MIVPCRYRSSSPQRRRQWSDAPTGQDQASRALTIRVRHCCHVPRQQLIPIRLCGTVVRGSSGCVRGAGCCRSHNVYLSSVHVLDARKLWSIGASRTVQRHVCPAIWDRSKLDDLVHCPIGDTQKTIAAWDLQLCLACMDLQIFQYLLIFVELQCFDS